MICVEDEDEFAGREGEGVVDVACFSVGVVWAADPVCAVGASELLEVG